MSRVLVPIAVCVFFSGFTLGNVFALSPTETLVQKLENIHTFKADFHQTLSSESNPISESQGHMELMRPGRFRWESTAPVAQLIVADGQQVWIDDIELEQVTIKSQKKALQGTPALFLSDQTAVVLKDYTVQERAGIKNEIKFELRARTHRSTFTHMTLVFKNDQLRAMRFVDQLGQTTQIVWNNVQMNLNLPANLFLFKPPRGFDVIRE